MSERPHMPGSWIGRAVKPRHLAIGGSVIAAAAVAVVAVVVATGGKSAAKQVAASAGVSPSSANSNTANPSSVSPTSATPVVDLSTINWGDVTVPGKACMSTADITLHSGQATITNSTTPGASFLLRITVQPQYGQLGNGGPMVATFGLSCLALGSDAGSHPLRLVSVAVFDALNGTPHLVGLITNPEFGRIAPADTFLVPNKLAVHNGAIVVTGAYLQLQDPGCCPSGQATAAITYRNGRLVPELISAAGSASGSGTSSSSTAGGGSPPSRSASAPSTANNGAGPQCTQAALQSAVNVGRPKGQLAVVHAGDFACAGTWAVTAAVIPANREQVTVLLRWTSGTWQSVDRQIYCSNGQIPAGLRTRACQSN